MKIVTSHRAYDLKKPVDYIRCRTEKDKEILRKWQIFFLQKDVPFRTIVRNGNIILQKDFKTYNGEELENLGWNIKSGEEQNDRFLRISSNS